MSELSFVPLEPCHLLSIERQPSQATILGMDATFSVEEAEQLAAQPEAYAVLRGEDPVACIGIAEAFAGRHGIGWAVLASGIGQAHIALTRWMRARIAAVDLPRLECFARCRDMEDLLARFPDLDSGQIVEIAMSDPTPECRWAVMLGLRPVHLLRQYGAAGESYMLFERIAARPAPVEGAA